MAHLPVSRAEMAARGWEELDFLFVTGDAYVDHPSFGAAILSRLLEDEGYRVGVVAQPALDDPSAFLALGKPRLAVLVSSGVVDSMVNHYTASRKRRSTDLYSPGGRAGLRPDRALIRYCGRIREWMGDIPMVIGGIEASLRRFAHYDFWSDRIRRSILQDSQADLLVYGMGERPLLEVARLLAKGVSIRKINSIRGTCVLQGKDRLPKVARDFITAHEDRGDDAKTVPPENDRFILLPSYEAVTMDKAAFAVAFRCQYREQDQADGKTLLQKHGGRYLMQNPPQRPLSMREMDRIYDLPYERTPHPIYQPSGGVPAIEEVRFSITSHRGCYGGCHFCAIGFHQGRLIQRRSAASILREAEKLTGLPDFKGYIHDVGGPTANFYSPACNRQRDGHVCKDRQCLIPKPCPSFVADTSDYLSVLRRVRALPGVKKVFIRSGIRFDAVLMDKNPDFFFELCEHHVSGQLKVAPEHVSRNALRLMGKPPPEVYRRFRQQFNQINEGLGLKQYLVPYLISGHPGCSLADAIELAQEIKAGGVMPEQVQAFYPTSGTVSTTMYYTGMDPFTLAAVHVPDEHESNLQRALLQFGKPENRIKVITALREAGRSDLIGFGEGMLLAPAHSRNKPMKNANMESEERTHGNHHQRTGLGKGDSRKDRRGSQRDHR